MFALSARPTLAARPVAATRAVSARGVAAAPARALRASVVAKAEPKTPLEAAIEEAKDTCESGSSGECAVAWDTVSSGRDGDQGERGAGERQGATMHSSLQAAVENEFSFSLSLGARRCLDPEKEKGKVIARQAAFAALKGLIFPLLRIGSTPLSNGCVNAERKRKTRSARPRKRRSQSVFATPSFFLERASLFLLLLLYRPRQRFLLRWFVWSNGSGGGALLDALAGVPPPPRGCFERFLARGGADRGQKGLERLEIDS